MGRAGGHVRAGDARRDGLAAGGAQQDARQIPGAGTSASSARFAQLSSARALQRLTACVCCGAECARGCRKPAVWAPRRRAQWRSVTRMCAQPAPRPSSQLLAAAGPRRYFPPADDGRRRCRFACDNTEHVWRPEPPGADRLLRDCCRAVSRCAGDVSGRQDPVAEDDARTYVHASAIAAQQLVAARRTLPVRELTRMCARAC